ncbi:hypothetical protein C8R45DRAFT_941174 [Mycena sanguinolenta]|nr:hypothetical protein C8R45DRAFT_941174 [Mycena sanguinolenta]
MNDPDIACAHLPLFTSVFLLVNRNARLSIDTLREVVDGDVPREDAELGECFGRDGPEGVGGVRQALVREEVVKVVRVHRRCSRLSASKRKDGERERSGTEMGEITQLNSVMAEVGNGYVTRFLPKWEFAAGSIQIIYNFQLVKIWLVSLNRDQSTINTPRATRFEHVQGCRWYEK